MNDKPAAPPSESELTAHAENRQAPRVTQADVDSAIHASDYYVFPGSMLTVCCLTMLNGYTVTGESACAHPAMFDEAIGRRIAYKNAESKVWGLLGYALREKIHNA